MKPRAHNRAPRAARALTAPELRIAGRLLELAEKGRGRASPNPLVGAAVVKGGRIIAEGHYRKFGGPHAEIMALARAGARARGATLWVSLEPCTIHAKTPPCTDAIIAAGVREVIFLASDPNPRIEGTSIRALKRGGVKARLLAHAPAYELNRGFAVWVRKLRPLTRLKAAVSLDGRIADFTGRSRGLGDARQLAFTHHLRSVSDAVLVGAGTALRDDPRLTVRKSATGNPPIIRIVLDRALRVPRTSRLADGIRAGNPLWIVTEPARADSAPARAWARLGARILPIADRGPGFPKRLLGELARRGVTALLVEGGATVLGRFIRERAYDCLQLCVMPVLLGDRGVPLARLGPVALSAAPRGRFDGCAGQSGFHSIAFYPERFSVWARAPRQARRGAH